jgi:hypothetical protein
MKVIILFFSFLLLINAAEQKYRDFAVGLKPGLRSESFEENLQHIHGLYYEAWCTTALRSGSSTVESDYGQRVTANLIVLLCHYSSDLLFQGKFTEVFSMKDTFNRIAIKKSHADVTKFVDLALNDLDQFIRRSVVDYFNILMSTENFSTGFQIALAYKSLDVNQSQLWLEKIKTSALDKIKEHVTTSVLLQGLDLNLAAKNLNSARNIIDSFPDGSDIKNQLEAALQAAIADVRASQRVQVSSDWLNLISERL